MASPRTTVAVEPTPDPFRFGWRLRSRGRERIPLTPEDVLHPQFGDEIPKTTIEERDLFYLKGAFRWALRNRTDCLVLSDCLVDWGIPSLRNHSPDLCVFEGVHDRERNWSMFRVVQEGARPLLALEIVSVDPELRPNDVTLKVRQYHRAGVPLYFLIDQQETEGPRQLLGYRRGQRRYSPLRLDGRGWVGGGAVGAVVRLARESGDLFRRDDQRCHSRFDPGSGGASARRASPRRRSPGTPASRTATRR